MPDVEKKERQRLSMSFVSNGGMKKVRHQVAEGNVSQKKKK